MPYDGLSVYHIAKELKKLTGTRIHKVYQPVKDELILFFSDKDKSMVQICANPSFSRISTTSNKYDNPMNPSGFCMLMRKYLIGAQLRDVYQKGFDRILVFSVENLDDAGRLIKMSLVCEIMGKHSNIILINDETGKIIDSIKHVSSTVSSYREVLPKRDYVSPPNDKLDPLDYDMSDCMDIISFNADKNISAAFMNTFSGISKQLARSILIDINEEDRTLRSVGGKNEVTELTEKFITSLKEKLNEEGGYLYYDEDGKVKEFSSVYYSIFDEYTHEKISSMNLATEKYFLSKSVKAHISERYEHIITKVASLLSREESKLAIRNRELSEAQDSEKYNIAGTLLLSNLHLMKKGETSVEVDNYYEEGMPKLRISLEPHLNPTQNANRYFKLYTKAKNAVIHLEKLIEESENEIYFLSSQLCYLKNASNASQAEEIIAELVKHGTIKVKNAKGIKKDIPSAPMRLMFGEYEILVGRNDRQNDRLTFKMARADDIWLHTKDIAGSHVILRTENGTAPDEALDAAAKLAAFYSKGRESGKTEVDYTFAKYVKKPAGAPAGKVIYTNQHTVYVGAVSPEEMGAVEIKQTEQK
ncbi:MAG: fibronectin/fibrinogen-binding protein [Anaerofustis stercorihominis]|nr:fibronectin/fibrinogen-binding protein [Anaerofustis stercorihominis]